MAASGSIEAGQPGEDQPDVGARLRSAREAQQLSLDDVAAELRISAPALAALEENRFEALGPPVFAKGYLKQYGARLGLAIDELAADYEKSTGAASVRIAPSQTIKLRDERQITIWIVSALLLALLVVFLALWWLRQPGPVPETAVTDEPGAAAPVAREPDVTEPAAAEPAESESAAAGPAESESAAAGPAESEPAAAGPAEVEPAAAEPAAAESAAAAPANTAPAAAGGPADDLEPGAPREPDAAIEGPALDVVFVEDSWAEITSGDGERLFYALGEAGTRQRFPADPALNLLFGNAGGVELSIDGRAVVIPGSPQSGEVAQFALATLID